MELLSQKSKWKTSIKILPEKSSQERLFPSSLLPKRHFHTKTNPKWKTQHQFSITFQTFSKVQTETETKKKIPFQPRQMKPLHWSQQKEYIRKTPNEPVVFRSQLKNSIPTTDVDKLNQSLFQNSKYVSEATDQDLEQYLFLHFFQENQSQCQCECGLLKHPISFICFDTEVEWSYETKKKSYGIDILQMLCFVPTLQIQCVFLFRCTNRNSDSFPTLKSLFACSKITKFVYSANGDIQRLTDFGITNLCQMFDVQQTNTKGEMESLTSRISKCTKLDIPTKSIWTKKFKWGRKLTLDKIEYALLDVLYLYIIVLNLLGKVENPLVSENLKIDNDFRFHLTQSLETLNQTENFFTQTENSKLQNSKKKKNKNKKQLGAGFWQAYKNGENLNILDFLSDSNDDFD